ncbi:hypothetical protein PHMEG_0001720 [Phytophthora megakarya]|uniref:Uncharacterized protein n=1 Tax=Phytophthora megakarya TaxID=4795 RepID=A0A225X255_9STRA|nr:hypothetical protein PHMEG_0001720 [Phytophthora megakarya]
MPGRISRDELVVLQLLEEIQRLVELAGGETKPGEDINPRMHPAAKLYLDTRDTFEVIENLVEEHLNGKPKLLRTLSKQHSDNETIATPAATPRSSDEVPVAPVPNDAAIDRIQEMFRHLGSLLGPSILIELRLRKLSIQSILHYVRFLPMEYQWTAYKEARKEEVELVFRESVHNSLSNATTPIDTQTLRQRADFVKLQIRKDVDTVCLFAADGTLTTIFDDDDGATVEENVATKFESLIADVYSSYLRESIETQINLLMQVSNQWAHDIAVTPPSSKNTTESGQLVVQCFYRPRKFRSKGGIFPDMLMNLMNRHVQLPTVHPGQQAKILVADPHNVGVWWQKTVYSVSERDVTTLHDDASREIFQRVETLDGRLYVPLLGKGSEHDGSRLFGRSGGLSKWIGQRVLVNNGKDSLWVNVIVVDVDDKRCKLQINKALQKCNDIVSWTQFLSLNEWVHMRELRFIGAPVNPDFRVQMGLKFREILESVQAVVVEISSVFPNGELNDKVSTALWKSMEQSISRGEHIFARYFRSILQNDTVNQVTPTTHPLRGRSISAARPSSLGNHFDENGMYGTHLVSRLGRGSTSTRTSILEITTSARVLSPFEKLAHHLLEETEIIGTCIQAQNVALSCAFVQVLLEKIDKMKQHMQTILQVSSCTVEYVVSEHANSCRLLFVWRICRHQVDTMARQGRKHKRRNHDNDSRYIHLNWVDHAFERVETQIVGMMNWLVHYAHRAFFHECMNHLLPGIYEQSWTASKPWFGNTRCTYAVQGFVFRMQQLLEHVNNTVLVGYERNLGVHEKVFELTVRMLLNVFACAVEAYENLIISRAREGQWKIDILYLVCGVYKLLRHLDQMFSARGASQSAKSKCKGTAW